MDFAGACKMTLPLPFGRPLRPVTEADIGQARSFPKTLSTIVNETGSKDAAVAMDVGLEASVFSKTVSGQVGIFWEKLDRLMDVCGSELPLMWMLYQRGYDPASLRKRESELERQLREERETVERLTGELETIKNFVRETGRTP